MEIQSSMRHTTLPTSKGQITIPAEIRRQYDISEETPLIIEDAGKGVITIRVMRMVEHDDIEWLEDDKEFGLHFKKGVDPELLIKAIKKMDG